MTDQPRASRFDLTASQKRLADFCNETGRIAPGSLLDEDGAPTDELLALCREADLSLDWLFQDDPSPAVGRADLGSGPVAQFRTSLQHAKDEATSIEKLFHEWCDLLHQASADDATDDEVAVLIERCAALEGVAVTLPAVTALDVWRLIRMTTEEKGGEARTTAEKLVVRAYAEAAD